jgi:pyruvate formate lyase activating enzyme
LRDRGQETGDRRQKILIMEGLVFDIKKFSVNDGPGIRTTVFFKGCPLRCVWCHNPESQESKAETLTISRKLDGKIFDNAKEIGRLMESTEVMEEILKDAVFYEESKGGVTFSGGEPTMQADFLLELSKSCKKHKLHTALDTCGYASAEILTELLPLIDLFLFDLKLINEDLHIKYTGYSNKTIIDNLKMLSFNKANIIIRIPVIPGITDTPQNLNDIAALVASLPQKINEIHLLPYHSIAANKYKRLDKQNPLKDLQSIRKEDVLKHQLFFEEKGFIVRIGG